MAAIKRTFPQSLIENICRANNNKNTRILFDLLAEQRLTPREAKVIRCRYGYYSKVDTLEEVAKLDGTTRERIRQIEQKALRKLNLSYITKFILNLLNENKALKLEREQILKNQLNKDTDIPSYMIYNVNKISVCYVILTLATKFYVCDLFTTRPAHCLMRGGIQDLGKLLLTDNDTICKLRNLGEKSKYEIFNIISELFTDEGYDKFILEIQERNLFDNISVLKTISVKEFSDFIELLKRLPDTDYIYNSIIDKSHNELNFTELQKLLNENYSKDIDLNHKYKQLQNEYKDLKTTLNEHKKQIEEKYIEKCNKKLEEEKTKLENKLLKNQYKKELELEKDKLNEEYKNKLQLEIIRVKRNYENQKVFNTKDEIRKTLKVDVETELETYKEMCKRNIDAELKNYKQEQLNQIKNKTDQELNMYLIGRLSAPILNNSGKTGIKINRVGNNINITYLESGDNNE